MYSGIKKSLFSCDMFSQEISLHSTRRTATNPRQYHGSWFGLILTAIFSLSVTLYFSYLNKRMWNFEDDKYSKIELVNTF